MDTSHPGNVGAAARAMKVMGFSDLVLVAPRLPTCCTREEAIAMASGAADVLARRARRGNAGRGARRREPCVRHGDDAARLRPADASRRASCFATLAAERPAAWRSCSAASASAWPTTTSTAASLLSIPTAPGLRLAQPRAGGAADRLRLAPGARRLRRACRARRRHRIADARGGAGGARALAAGAGRDRLPRPGGAEEADAAPEPAVQPRATDAAKRCTSCAASRGRGSKAR